MVAAFLGGAALRRPPPPERWLLEDKGETSSRPAAVAAPGLQLALQVSRDNFLRPYPHSTLIDHQVGGVRVSVDQMGQYYIDGLSVSRMMLMQPERALGELARLPHGELTEAAYRSAFSAWAGGNPANATKAAGAALALPPGPERTAALVGAADSWARRDAGALLDWAVALPPTDSAVLTDALIAAGNHQPALAAQYVANLTDASARNQVIAEIADSWSMGYWRDRTNTDPAAALDWLNQVANGTTYDKAVKSIFSDLAENDPAGGADLLVKLSDPLDREAVIAQLADQWSAKDPVAALAWAQALPEADGVVRTAALRSAVAGLAGQDLPAALAYVQGLSNPPALLSVAPVLAQAMAKMDPPAALDWVANLPGGLEKDQAVSTVLVAMAASDFSAAWTQAAALPAGVGHDGAMDSLVAALSKHDPAQAADFLEKYDTGVPGESAIVAVAANWAKTDPTAAAAWIETLPLGDQRDAATVKLVTVTAIKDPAAALAFANSIGNANDRFTQIKNVVSAWAKSDPDTAVSAVASANLSAAQRALLRVNLAQASSPAK